MCVMSGITATARTVRSTGSVRDVYMSNEQSESCYSLHFIESVLLYRVVATTLEYVCTRGISPHSGLFVYVCIIMYMLFVYVFVCT